MSRSTSVAAAAVLGLALTVLVPTSANAATRVLRNDPAYANTATCSGTVAMSNYYTDRSDINVATYYDEYIKAGAWTPGAAKVKRYDSDTDNPNLLTNLSSTSVRVRADRNVTTTQGSSCS